MYIGTLEALNHILSTQAALPTAAVLDLHAIGYFAWNQVFSQEWSLPDDLTVDFGERPVSIIYLNEIIQFLCSRKEHL